MTVINQTTPIMVGKHKFLIMDAPSAENLTQYIHEMLQHGVTDLVHTCELTYSEEPLIKAGVNCHDLAFPDGDPPPKNILIKWLQLVDEVTSNKGCIAIHCVAGLGRAPVLVAVALIEKENFDPFDAIEYIRARRKGAINRRQLQYLRSYNRQKKSGRFCGMF